MSYPVPSDHEERAGVEPLVVLLAERDALVHEVAPLRAEHGPGGTWDALRKVQLSTVAMKLRAEAIAGGTKVTEAYLETAAHADSDYVRFVTDGTLAKAKWAELENRIQGVNDQINRGQALLRFLAAEVSLTPR